MNKKQALLFLVPFIVIASAFASHETSFNFHLQSFDLNSNGTAYLVPMGLDIFSTATCSGTPIFTSSCTTDVNGVCDIPVTMNTSYNQIMYACIYANNTLLSGSPSQFRAGFGQVTDGDVSFTNLTADNFIGGNFYGDGSQLTNLNLSSVQYWNRTGTRLLPYTSGDEVYGQNIIMPKNVGMIMWDNQAGFQYIDMGLYETGLVIGADRDTWLKIAPSNRFGIGNAPQLLASYSYFTEFGDFHLNGRTQYFDNANLKKMFWNSTNNYLEFDDLDIMLSDRRSLGFDNWNAGIYYDKGSAGQELQIWANTGEQIKFYNNITAEGYNMTADNFFGNFIGDGSGITNITADDLDINDNEWLYLNTADTIGLRWNSTGNNIEMNQRLYVPNMISANSVDASLGYFDWLQIGFKGFSTGNPFTILNSTGTQKIVMNFDGNIIFADNDDNQYILWNTSTGGGGGIGLWDSGTYNSLELWSGGGVDDNIELYNPTNVWGNLTMISGNVTADYFFGDGSQLTNLPVGTSYWNRTGTTLFTATAGDDVSFDGDIYLNSTGKKIYLDNNLDKWIWANSVTSNIELDPNGNEVWVLSNLVSTDSFFANKSTGYGFILRPNVSISFDFPTNSKSLKWDGGNTWFSFSDDVYSTGLLVPDDAGISWVSSGERLIYNSSVTKRFEFSDNLFVNGNVTASYFIGDGSQLTNLPVSAQYWNRTGTTLEPATLGDDVNLTGELYLQDDNPIIFDVASQNGIYYDSTNNYLQISTDNGTYFDNTIWLGQNNLINWNTKTLTYNSTSARFEFNDKVFAPDFETNAKQLDVEFLPRFLLTGASAGGGATATVGIDTVNDRRIYSRFTFGGGTNGHTGYHRFELDPLIDSWNTTNSIKVWIRSNTVAGITFSANLYYGTTLDGAVNGTQTKQVTTANTWEQWELQPSDAPTPNDIVNLEVICTSTVNGANCDLSDIEIYYLRDKF